MGPLRSAVPLLARRFLLSKYSDGFLSFISGVSVFGVCLGVMALTVVTSVINGFENELVRVITGMNGEVILYTRGDSIRNADTVIAEIKRVLPQAEAVAPSFVMELMVAGPAGVAGGILQGVDRLTVGKVTDIPNRVVVGRMPEADAEVVVGTALADKLGIGENSEIRLIVPFTGDANSSPKVLRARVVGLAKMGLYDYDSKFLFMTLPAVQKFLQETDRVTNFNIKLAPGTNARRASDLLADSFSFPFRAKDWGQLNKNLFSAIKLEKAVIAIILTVIVIVAAFNVVSTLMMMIHDKSKEIAILKAMGFRPFQSFQLFCIIGLGIGAVGTALGIASGLGLGALLARTRLIDLPSDIYFISFLPVIVRWPEIGLIAGMALVIALLATFYPAWKVSRQSPLDGLRYE